jgi:hypothetical protein
MEKDFSPVRALGYMFLAVTAVGAASLFLITAVHPGLSAGVMRFLLLIVVNLGILMAVIWMAVASAVALRFRLRSAD